MLGHLLSASYLYAIDEQPSGVWPGGALLWALMLMVVIGYACLRRSRSDARACLGIAMVSAAMGALWLGVRPWLVGPFSARIWPLSLTSLALAGLGADAIWPRVREYEGPGLKAAALALRPGDPSCAPMRDWFWLLVHGVGLLVMIQGEPDMLWLAFAAVALPTIAWLVERHEKGRKVAWRVELVAPLWLCHVATVLRLAVEGALGVDTAPYAAFAYPDLWSIWFDAEAVALAAGAWIALCSLSLCGHALNTRWLRARRWAILGLAPLCALVWFVATMARHLSHGATGSDAFCYLQMASDLALHGTALHAFPLAGWVTDLALPIWPLVHVGYHPPAVDGLAATVWPIGWPVMLAPLMGLGGDALALWAAPICLALTAAAVWRLPQELSLSSLGHRNHLVGGIAAALTLTSFELVMRSLVPMADAAAALWTVLLALCLARAHRTGRIRWDALAGLSLGMAYWVRHPLLWLGLGVAVYYGFEMRDGRRRGLVAFSAIAFLTAVPDLIYHTLHWGAPWHTESSEWFLISLANIPGSFAGMLKDGFLRTNELGYLWPWIAVGVWSQVRSRGDRRVTSAMVIGALGVLVFALCYEALRWRDLLALVPLMSLWAAEGMAAAWDLIRKRAATRTLVCGVLLLSLAARSTPSYRLPVDGHVWTFGYVTAEQRAGFDELDRLLPEDAVVATGINSGAVERYTGCQTVRPAAWQRDEALAVLDDIMTRGSHVYILDDSTEMTDWMMSLDPNHLVFVGEIDLPCFGLGGQAMNRPAALYRWLPLPRD